MTMMDEFTTRLLGRRQPYFLDTIGKQAQVPSHVQITRAIQATQPSDGVKQVKSPGFLKEVLLQQGTSKKSLNILRTLTPNLIFKPNFIVRDTLFAKAVTQKWPQQIADDPIEYFIRQQLKNTFRLMPLLSKPQYDMYQLVQAWPWVHGVHLKEKIHIEQASFFPSTKDAIREYVNQHSSFVLAQNLFDAIARRVPSPHRFILSLSLQKQKDKKTDQALFIYELVCTNQQLICECLHIVADSHRDMVSFNLKQNQTDQIEQNFLQMHPRDIYQAWREQTKGYLPRARQSRKMIEALLGQYVAAYAKPRMVADTVHDKLDNMQYLCLIQAALARSLVLHEHIPDHMRPDIWLQKWLQQHFTKVAIPFMHEVYQYETQPWRMQDIQCFKRAFATMQEFLAA